ncbi:hypothetical protein [Flavobacterium adhaerens]|uniref:hypothetical protein n=1 Tax=Flavobacterium adhaerens TaxID=3149043 RepID=UPI0032B4CAB8
MRSVSRSFISLHYIKNTRIDVFNNSDNLDIPHFEYGAYREVLLRFNTQKNTQIDVFNNFDNHDTRHFECGAYREVLLRFTTQKTLPMTFFIFQSSSQYKILINANWIY